MSNTPQKKKPFPWRRYLLLIVAVAIVLRTHGSRPRSTWRLQDSQPTAQMRESVRQAVANAKDIRRVVLISIDTLRADHLGCYGYPRDTSPSIDSLARESVVFNHAVACTPITLPSHCSMLTGTTPPQHQVHDNIGYQLHSSSTTLAEILKENGFTTGAVIGAYPLDAQFGLDQGFDTYDDDIKQAQAGVFKFANERDAAEVTELANKWLKNHRKEEFLLFVHYYDPHLPYESHEEFRFRYVLPWPSVRDQYDGEIAYTDYYVGRLIDNLKQMGLYDSTLIILTGDHGESLGERQERGHGFFIYHNTIHVPLIVKLPGLSTMIRVNDVVGLIDIVPTVCSLLGIDSPAAVEGQDVLAAFSQDAPSEVDRSLYCESLRPTIYDAQPLAGLVTSRYKYIETTRPELYDLGDDPRESDNLIKQNPDVAAVLREDLMAILDQAGDQSQRTRVQLDDESLARLGALGYVGAGGVKEDFDFEQPKEDPKDLIKWHELWQDTSNLIFWKEYAKAKPLVLDIIARLPSFYDPAMPTLAHALAIHTDPAIRDPQAALTIARHGAAATEYRNAADLQALVAACAAAGLQDEAMKSLDMLNTLGPTGTGPDANKDKP